VTPFTMCLLLTLAAEPSEGPAVRLYQFSPKLAAAIRAQDPGTFVTPMAPVAPMQGTPTLEAPIPATPDTYNPFQPQMNAPAQMQDPFMAGPDPVLSSPDLMGSMYSGVNGPQPFRYGFIPRLDIGYIPESDLKSVNGGVEMFEFDKELRWNAPFSYGWVYSSAAQFDYRAWNFDGPGIPSGRLNLYRFGWDMQLISPEVNGWQWQFQFNPAIVTDFEHPLNQYGWNFDGTIVSYYRFDQMFQMALGVTVWDRVDTFVLPYAGLIITPDDRWEFRLLFPKSRISYFLGQCGSGWHWLYVSSEFRVDSYQAEIPPGTIGNAIQYEDWRLALGLRSDHGWFDKYIEVAWVLGRNFQFAKSLPKTDIDDSVMVRAGIRF